MMKKDTPIYATEPRQIPPDNLFVVTLLLDDGTEIKIPVDRLVGVSGSNLNLYNLVNFVLEESGNFKDISLECTTA